MVAKSRLHVPKTPARTGDAPDFSYLKLSPAGAIERPDVGVPARQIRSLADGLVRVLDDKHRAVGPWNPHLDPSELQVGLRHMLLTRVFDDRMQRIQRSGKISFYMRSLGEEAEILSIGVTPRLRRKGCARAMMEDVIRAARDEGVRKLFLEVDVANAAAAILYESLGFERIGRRKRYYRNGGDALVMRLNL